MPTARLGRYPLGPKAIWNVLRAATMNMCLAVGMSLDAELGVVVVESLSMVWRVWPLDRRKSVNIVVLAEILLLGFTKEICPSLTLERSASRR